MSAAELKILAIDTATEACSVALNLHGAVTQRFEIAPNGHSKLVLDMAESLLKQCGLDLQQLDALAVDVGPGSFTGLRIGIGVAQGLAYGAGRKVIPVGSLDALAHGVFYEASHEASQATVLAAIDARMGQIYYGLYGLYGRPEKKPRTLIEPALASPESLAVGDAVGDGDAIVGAGSGWDCYAPVMLEALGGSVAKWLAGRHPEAATVSRMAAAAGLESAISPLALSAVYVRDSVAVRP